MFTPSEILEKSFKNGIGYDKKDVEQFLSELSSDFEALLQENANLKKNNHDLNESISYYKSIEKTLHRALILAEKTAQDTKASAYKEAEAIEAEAKLKASAIVSDSRQQVELLEHKMLNLMQQYDMFKIQFENLLHAQLELLGSKSFSVNIDDYTYKRDFGDNTADNLTDEIVSSNSEAATSVNSEEDFDQIQFEFMKDEFETQSYSTEDGFEFITLKGK